MNKIENFYQIPIPIPVPLKVVNCYLCQTDAGWHIIDTGYHTEEAESIWMETFRTLNIAPGDIAEIVLTHFHPDHLGMAGFLQAYTGAPVKLSSIDCRTVESVWRDRREMELFEELAAQHGMREDLIRFIQTSGIEELKLIYPLPELTPFEDGERFEWGDTYTAILTPGHADGHMAFYSPEKKLILCGDLLLPKITPNVGYFPGHDPNPLDSFLTTLEKIQSYDMRTVLPGHRQIYSDGNERARHLIVHHKHRLQELLDTMTEPMNAFQLSNLVFAHVVDSTSALQHRFAFQETLAHLIYLEGIGLVSRGEDGRGVIQFSKRGDSIDGHFRGY